MTEIANALNNIAEGLIFLTFVIIFKSFGTTVHSTPWHTDYQQRIVEALEKLTEDKKK